MRFSLRFGNVGGSAGYGVKLPQQNTDNGGQRDGHDYAAKAELGAADQSQQYDQRMQAHALFDDFRLQHKALHGLNQSEQTQNSDQNDEFDLRGNAAGQQANQDGRGDPDDGAQIGESSRNRGQGTDQNAIIAQRRKTNESEGEQAGSK